MASETGRFAGKVALVTGAARGIGRGIALRLARERAIVVVNDIEREGGCERVSDEITAAGGEATVVRADVGDPAEVERMIGEALASAGRLDILVNNAGVETGRPALDLTDDDWDRVFAVNARGVFLCSRAAGRVMRDRGAGGKIVNISSLCGHMAWEGAAHYCASKAAIDMWTRALALELAPDRINVNAVAPGIVLTEIVPELREDGPLQRRALAQTPSGRFGTPDDIAGAVAFLCSPDADWIHGQVLTVDGGFWLGWRSLE